MKQYSLAAVCAVGLVVTGCAEKPLELDAKSLSAVHRISVVGPSDPVPFGIVTQGEVNAQQAVTAAAAIPFAGVLGAAVAGGIAGAIVAEVDRETSKPLNDAIAAEKYSYATDFQQALVAALKADGYEVSMVSLVHKPQRFADKLEAAGGQSDLVLDAVASASCTDVGVAKNAHFRPVVRIQVKLIRPGNATPIMNKTFVYDEAVATPDAFQLKGDPKYNIADYAALKANVKGCIEGIKATTTPLAGAVGAVVAQQKQVATK